MIVNIQEAINDLKNEKPIIIFDKDIENEGDLVYPSEIINTKILNMMLNKCKGVICQTLTPEIIERLEIPIFKKQNNNITGQTNFVYPVDHINSETGISCIDREMIIKELVNSDATKEKLVIPGHQNLLRISANGIYERQGHTESSSELVQLAGYKKSAVICEIINKDGIPMRLPQILEFSQKHKINIIYLNDIYQYFLNMKVLIEPRPSYIKNIYQYLSSKVCIITGGSSGIGEKIKNTLSKYNCSCIDLSRTNNLDINDHKTINEYISNIGKIDFLINCAGYIEPCSIKDMTIENWNNHLNTNLTSVFNIIQNTIELYNETGVIINITSPSANKVRKNWSAYCCTKAALNSFTLNAAEELKDKNIKVFGISPSKTNTPMIHRLFPEISDEKLIPTEEIAQLTMNILASSYINNNTGIIYEVSKNI